MGIYFQYDVFLHTVHNIVIIVGIILLYVAFVIILVVKIGSNQSHGFSENYLAKMVCF